MASSFCPLSGSVKLLGLPSDRQASRARLSKGFCAAAVLNGQRPPRFPVEACTVGWIGSGRTAQGEQGQNDGNGSSHAVLGGFSNQASGDLAKVKRVLVQNVTSIPRQTSRLPRYFNLLPGS